MKSSIKCENHLSTKKHKVIIEEKSLETKARKTKLWEQKIPVETKVSTRTYHCPICNVPIFSVPVNLDVPKEKEVVVCPNGHKVKVPAFSKIQRIY